MGALSKFTDGITSLTNRLANRRNAHNTNTITAQRISFSEARAIYRTGVGSKIVRLKSGIALNDTLQFANTEDEQFYKRRLQQHVKNCAKFQLAFGRSLLVIHEPGADLSTPLGKITDWGGVRYHVFSGDMVYVQSVNLDLNSPQYFKPTRYSVRGFTIHPSRCIDFTYVEPTEYDAPEYFYGGISEFELIRNELVSDQVVQRAVPAILEKSSTMFYKITGFKQAMADKVGEDGAVAYFEKMEDLRSVYGAGVLDEEDSVEVFNQSLSNLSESDMITLRRLALVTGLPLSWLVGEAAKGLNSTGEGERQVMKHTIASYQSEYLLENINRLMRLHGRGEVEFKGGLLETDADRIKIETEAIKNALVMSQIGEDYGEYLERYNIRKPDPWADMFAEPKEQEIPDVNLAELLGDETTG